MKSKLVFVRKYLLELSECVSVSLRPRPHDDFYKCSVYSPFIRQAVV